MSIICKLFGHKPGMGYYNHDGGGYLTVIGGPIDGLGTEHARVFSECPPLWRTLQGGEPPPERWACS